MSSCAPTVYAAVPGNVFFAVHWTVFICYCCFYKARLGSGKKVHYSVFLTTYNQTVLVLVLVFASLAINQCSWHHTCITEPFVSLSDLKELIFRIVSFSGLDSCQSIALYSCRK